MRARWLPRALTSVTCVCMFVSCGEFGWKDVVSSQLCCSGGVRKTPWPKSWKRLSLKRLIKALSCCPGAVFLTEKTPKLPFRLCVRCSSFSEMTGLFCVAWDFRCSLRLCTANAPSCWNEWRVVSLQPPVLSAFSFLFCQVTHFSGNVC